MKLLELFEAAAFTSKAPEQTKPKEKKSVGTCSVKTVRAALKAENIAFEEEPFFNNFHGTRFLFDKKSEKNVKAALKKHDVNCEVSTYFKKSCIEIY